jgi:hypothetical protein
MALTPIDETHALQIQAGTLGRKAGHAFEDSITEKINSFSYPFIFPDWKHQHVSTGDPAFALLRYISLLNNKASIESAVALSTGALATSEEGKKWLEINGVPIKRCKSDLILTIQFSGVIGEKTIGVSTKQCNNKTPTNAQLYFTTARGFSSLLSANGISVSDQAIVALRQFCGDSGFRPLDHISDISTRKSDPRRYFWEEITSDGREEWERIFSNQQDDVTRLLLQKAYLDDPFAPDLLLHKTKKSLAWGETETAIYSIDELIKLSSEYGGFWTKPYSVRKGAYRDPSGVQHDAPRFGVVQMQRGGQKQHPEQLQFNLEAGYFYKIGQGGGDLFG